MRSREQLNDFLVDAFYGVLRSEEEKLKTMGLSSLSISEVHVLDAVSRLEEEKRNFAGDIASLLRIAPPSLSVALKVLEKKGCVERAVDSQDRRRVMICLTDNGRNAVAAHAALHRRMVDGVLEGLDEGEADALASALLKLSRFFRRKDAV